MGVIKAANAPPSMTRFSMRDIEQQARALLLRARSQAEQLLAAAQTEADGLRKQAFEQGRADGKIQGIREGTDQGKKAGQEQAVAEHRTKLQALMQTLTEASAQFDASRLDLEAQGLREVIELACGIARRITRRQAIIDPQVLQENLVEAMKLVVHGVDLRVAVHPQQMKYLQSVLPQIQKTSPRLSHVELVEDETISPGGCKLLAGGGVVDADLETQLDRIIEQVLPAASQ